MRLVVFIFCSILGLYTAVAQSTVVDTAVLRKEYKAATWQGNINFHYLSAQGHQWYSQLLFSTPEFTSLSESYQVRLLSGYEFKTSEKTRVALGAKLNFGKNANYFLPRLSLAHHGKLATLDFIKELNTELSYNTKKKSGSTPLALFSGLIGLGKTFTLGTRSLYAALSYKAYLVTYTKAVSFNVFKNRTVDHSQWRFDVQYALSEAWRIGLYALWDTDRYYVLGTSGGMDAFGNPLPPTPDARLNAITPIVGLQVHYILHTDRREGLIPLYPSK